MELSDDGNERDIIRGEVRTRPSRFHAPNHSRCPARVCHVLSRVEKVGLSLEVETTARVLDPDSRTVSVHRADQSVTVYNGLQDLTGEPELPGFRIVVRHFFDR